MPPLWKQKLSDEFHGAVERLVQKTQNPSPEVSYPDPCAEADSKKYTLCLRDELQIANHIAFLAHSQEGVKHTSAACVEETEEGLIILLASNETPSKFTHSKLRYILTIMQNGVTQGLTSNILQEDIFEGVLDLSQERILQRIRPKGYPSPPYYRRPQTPLWDRINDFLRSLGPRSSQMSDLISRLNGLITFLRLLEIGGRLHEQYSRSAVGAIVRYCAYVSDSGGHRSLRERIGDIPGSQDIPGFIDVAQIDKLARYFTLSRDLAELATTPKYRHLFQNISLQFQIAYDPEIARGGTRKCFVHAEVQLILSYEHCRLEKPPRAIGCSKSACFLCDLLIQELGQYHISFAHRRLYDKWTIPNVIYLPSERVECFRAVFRNMINEMESLSNDTSAAAACRLSRPFGLESPVVLPLSAYSTSTPSTPRLSSVSPSPDLRDSKNVTKDPELALTRDFNNLTI
ncbi:hypothetical protein F5Y05DRAFT_344830 [Hypoxylon sp. FL0543]|nr:hypothetical protein F5Y05DRAFT_344830 [Hypoxylon sp. FL0543]